MPYTDPITKLVTERRDELERADTQLAAQESGIRDKRQQIAEELRKLDIAVEVYETFSRDRDLSVHDSGVGTDTVEVRVVPPSNGTGPDLTGLKIADAAAAVLRSRGGTARTKEILVTLQSAKRIAPGHNSYSTLFKTLNREPERFEKLDRGLWHLREEPMERP